MAMREEPSRAQSVGSGVMALDTGGISQELRAHPDWKDVVPSVTDAPTLGDGLRIAREHSGRSLAELSSLTRVPSRYLTALEQNDFSTLPNRVFSIGYVRAYAGSLGLDEQLAVERFKRESPDPSVPLQAPVGVAFEEVRRYSPRLIAAGMALASAALVWQGWRAGGPLLAAGAGLRSPRHLAALLAALGGAVFYILAVDAVGFILCSMVVLVSLQVALGVRVPVALGVALLATLVIHTCFYKLLRVPLPWGWLQPIAW